VQFAILGPLEVTAGGQPVRVGGARARAVLAMLVLRADRVVAADAIAEALWPGLEQVRAAANLQVRVSQLRSAFRVVGEPDRLITTPPGYLLRASAAEVDAIRFTELVAEGRDLLSRGDAASASSRLGAAIALWRGEPLADLAGSAWARGEVARLAEARLDALELRADARLACGEATQLVAELAALTKAHPLRERVWAQLMLALYLSGRQAEALAAYREARGHLVDELGIEPGAELRELEARILAQDPGLSRVSRMSAVAGLIGPDIDAGQQDTPPSATVLDTAIRAPVGRDAELAGIAEFLGHLCYPGGRPAEPSRSYPGGRPPDPQVTVGPHALVLTGEAGIGKTTLWEAGTRIAASLGFTVLACRPVESEAQLAFSALTDLLAETPEAAFAELPAPQRRALDAAMLRAEPTTQPPDRRAVAVASLGVLRRQCRSGPVLLAVDDLAFMDASSFHVLEYALRRLGTLTVGMLATARPGEPEELELRNALGPGLLRQLQVGPLSLDAFGAVLTGRPGRAPGRILTARLHDASGGNPFVGLELSAALAVRGWPADPGEPLPVPPSLRALVRGRLEALPSHARQALLYVAAVANPTVQVVVAADGDNARTGLDVAEAAGLIEVAGQRIRFSHPVLRSVAYSEATAGQRREAHRVLAGTAAEPEQRARHLALAAEGPDESVASALDDAAQSAYLRGAPAAAAEMASLAVSMTQEQSAADRTRRLMQAGELHYAAGDLDAARVMLERATAESDPGISRARALYLQAKVARSAQNGPVALALLEHGLAEAADDARLRTVLHRDLGFVLANLGDPGGPEHYRLALAHAERADDPGLLRQARLLCEFTEIGAGHPVRRDLVDRWLDEVPVGEPAAAAFTEHQAMELRPNVLASHMLRYSGDLAAARRLLLEEYDAVIEQGADSDLPMLALWLVELETWAGNWDLAENYAEQGYRAAVAGAGALAATYGMRSILRACRGQLIDARRDADLAIEGASSFGWALPALWGSQAHALASLSVGDAAAAHAGLDAISDRMLKKGIGNPTYARFVPDDVEALARLGRLGQAEELIGMFDEASRRAENDWAVAASGRCRALLAATRGAHDAAAAALEEAFATQARLAMPFDLARTHLVAAETHRLAGRRQAAARHAQTALGMFEQLGAVVWAARARDERARA
jgi:DNA-binding SARP family transcriptional activator